MSGRPAAQRRGAAQERQAFNSSLTYGRTAFSSGDHDHLFSSTGGGVCQDLSRPQRCDNGGDIGGAVLSATNVSYDGFRMVAYPLG